MYVLHVNCKSVLLELQVYRARRPKASQGAFSAYILIELMLVLLTQLYLVVRQSDATNIIMHPSSRLLCFD